MPSYLKISLLLVTSAAELFSGTLIPGFRETPIVGTGISSPTGMAVAPDGRVFVTQQGGQVRVIQSGVLLASPAVSLTVDSTGERGLIGIALDPNFTSNGFVYLHYTVPGSPAHNRVSRIRLSGNTMVPGSETQILNLESLSSATNHNGGTIRFGPDGKLYVAVGENANPTNAQTLTNRLGKILRINADGTVPSDNPFVATPGAQGAIFAFGLRNPFTFTFDPNSGLLYANDVGLNSFEEIDVVLAGRNYGWPIEEGPGPNPALIDPLFFYDHTNGPTGGCAIAGGVVFQADYFFADLCSGWIRRLELSGPPVASAFLSGASGIVSLESSGTGGFYYLQRGAGSNTGGLFLVTADAVSVDSSPDLIWQNDTTHQVTVHHYGAAPDLPFTGWNWLNADGFADWQVVAAADFDGNGVPDLVWMNPQTRQVTVNYYTAGGVFSGWNWLNAGGFPGWSVVAAADMNHDGAPDLIWQNDATRQVTVNYFGGAGGATFQGWNWLTPVGFPGWHVAAVADFDGNGTPDLVWQTDVSRQVTVNYYGGPGGATFQGWNWLLSDGMPGWTVVGANDFDGNGVADLVWQNDGTRQVSVHYYGGAQGAVWLGWHWLTSVGYPGWSALVPH